MPARADEYGDILNSNEIVLQRLRGTCPLDRPTQLRWESPGSFAPPATRGTCARPTPTAPTSTSTSRSDRRRVAGQLRPLRGPPSRVPRVGEDHRAGDRRASRRALSSPPIARWGAAAARARHLDGGPDPPLQARHRGLSRASGRDLPADRSAGSSPARALGWVLQAGSRTAPCATQLRQSPGALAHGEKGRYIADMQSPPSRCSTRSSEVSTGKETARRARRSARSSRREGPPMARSRRGASLRTRLARATRNRPRTWRRIPP